jgi:hypothetical protein
LRFLVDAASVEESIKTRQPRLSSARDLLHAVRSLITAMSRRRGRRHLIVLDDGSCQPPDAGTLQEIVDAAKMAEITIHGISQRESAWRDLCANTAGQWLLAPSDDAVPELLTGLYGYLTASYQVKYRSEVAQDGAPVDLKIEVCTDQGLGEVALRV